MAAVHLDLMLTTDNEDFMRTMCLRKRAQAALLVVLRGWRARKRASKVKMRSCAGFPVAVVRGDKGRFDPC